MTGQAERNYWGLRDIRERFAEKTVENFFRSEIALLERIPLASLTSALDIGCAAGRFRALLSHLGFTGRFHGVDIVPENIERARATDPDSCFHVGDALTLDLPGPFDLVNATGVMQNEIRYEDLMQHMVTLASRFVMFDVKVAALEQTLCDVDQAYCRMGDVRIPIICLARSDLDAMLARLSGVTAVTMIDYPTPFNAETTVPDWLTEWHSAGVLLELGETGEAPVVERIMA